MVDIETVMTRQLIIKWYERGQIDYSDLYVKMYIAYNAWFRKVTDCPIDHEAIKELLRRFIIWDDYQNMRTLITLGPIVEQIAILTAKRPVRPIGTGTTWDGRVKDRYDWRSLIYFWYQTRCDLFHGMTEPGQSYHDLQIKLAYESLHMFMSEIIRRMRFCFTDSDFSKLNEVRRLISSDKGPLTELREIEVSLYQKFIHSPDLWNVDMERA
jgi:hypothetical protein